nr:ribonuclease H-like domain-containing protein [Tanacetum cinerariifolium]
FRYDGDECDKGIMPTKIEVTLEQSQQGVSNDVSLRSIILSRDPLPYANGTYVLISSEESHRAVVTCLRVVSSQRTLSSIFYSCVNNMSVTQRSQTFGNTSRPNNVPRANNNGNRRIVNGPTLVCEHCGFNGHTIDMCFKLIGYPSDFGKRNNISTFIQNNQNFNKRFINNNNSVGPSSTSTFLDEQISTLISLIKENYLNEKGKVFKPIWKDLMDVKIIRIDKQVNGLYYFDSTEGSVILAFIFFLVISAISKGRLSLFGTGKAQKVLVANGYLIQVIVQWPWST